MARLIIFDNPLDSSKRRRIVLADGVPLLEWLDLNAPTPKGCTRTVWLNGRRIAEGSPHRAEAGDSVIVQMQPADPATIGLAVVQALVATAISFVVSAIFAPSRPKSGNTPAPSQVYGLTVPRNAARLGEPIPVAYGSVILTPDYAAQPYSEYQGNEQYIRTLLCLGQGEYDVHSMILGDSDAVAIPADVAAYSIFGPADHASTFGIIQGATGVRENVCTSADVADQELLAPNQASNNTPSTWYWRNASTTYILDPPGPPPDVLPTPGGAYDLSGATTPTARLAILPALPTLGAAVDAFMGSGYSDGPPAGTFYVVNHYVATAFAGGGVPGGSLVPPPGAATIGALKWVGPFETCKAGQVGISIELDFSFPYGLYDLAPSDGSISSHQVDVDVGVTPIDDAGAATGAEVIHSLTWTKTDNSALRFTEKITVASGRYRVRCNKTNDLDARPTTGERVYWTGLKFELEMATAPGAVYGNVTLAAIVLRASNAISGDAAASIRFRVTRRLPPPAGGTAVASVNPADVFADIVTARYGGNRPRNGDELDLDALDAARIRWDGHNGFNAVFDQPSTVWEALTLSVQTVSAAPLPVGTRMSLMQDGIQPDRTQIFTDANVVTGSLQISHGFDRDGTPVGQRVEYRDPRTFSAAALLDPPGAPDYETIQLFGCTDIDVALEHAILAANRRRLQRTTITFSTELEGLNCLPGDRIGVQARMPRWAQGARVVGVDGLLLKLDRPLEWTDYATHAVQMRDPMGVPHTLVPVTRGADFYEIVMPSLPFPPVVHGDPMEATQISFGVYGQEVSDWIVKAMQPQGATVAISATNYSEAVYEIATAPRVSALLHLNGTLADSAVVPNVALSYQGASLAAAVYSSGSPLLFGNPMVLLGGYSVTLEPSRSIVLPPGAFEVGTGPFTIELSFWEPYSPGTLGRIYFQLLDGGGVFRFAVVRDGSGSIYIYSPGGYSVTVTGAAYTTLHHMAICRNAAGYLALFIDGERHGNITSGGEYVPNIGTFFVPDDLSGFAAVIGGTPSAMLSSQTFYAGEWRLTVGLDRYYGPTCPVPVAPFPAAASRAVPAHLAAPALRPEVLL